MRSKLAVLTVVISAAALLAYITAPLDAQCDRTVSIIG